MDGVTQEIPVRLFARARELAGKKVIGITLAPGSTLGELRARIAAQFPQLKELLAYSALAVDNEWLDDTQTVPPKAEIALLPPVSGG